MVVLIAMALPFTMKTQQVESVDVDAIENAYIEVCWKEHNGPDWPDTCMCALDSIAAFRRR